MQSLIQLRKTIHLFFIPLALACFALVPQAQAVNPAPDGCYPGFTTAEGCNALNSLTTGLGNTGLGWYALFSADAADFNTAVGAGALALNTGDDNTAVGAVALLFNTTGIQNTAIGSDALVSNTIGMQNTAVGTSALSNNISTSENTAVGFQALLNNGSTDILATAIDNTAVGAHALESNIDGAFNTAIGDGALSSNNGNGNIALGNNAGKNLTSGSHNIDIFDLGEPDESNTIRIGSDGIQTATFIAGVYVATAGPAPLAVMCGNDGKLSALASSRRFKHDIKAVDKASEAILALKPVSFRYNDDPTNTPWVGLIAEEVASVNPDLIVRGKDGKPLSVRYDQVNAMLLNEFLKEHKTVQDLKSAAAKQEATIANQQKQIEALTAGLQKVSAQLELNKAAPQTVLNSQ